jgi:hypothetical protein
VCVIDGTSDMPEASQSWGEKNFHVFWEESFGHFSLRQWKGGGIDGRVSPRTGVSERKTWPIVWAHVAVAFVWGMLLLLVLFDLTLGVGR